jgi:hypothetical protein
LLKVTSRVEIGTRPYNEAAKAWEVPGISAHADGRLEGAAAADAVSWVDDGGACILVELRVRWPRRSFPRLRLALDGVMFGIPAAVSRVGLLVSPGHHGLSAITKAIRPALLAAAEVQSGDIAPIAFRIGRLDPQVGTWKVVPGPAEGGPRSVLEGNGVYGWVRRGTSP